MRFVLCIKARHYLNLAIYLLLFTLNECHVKLAINQKYIYPVLNRLLSEVYLFSGYGLGVNWYQSGIKVVSWSRLRYRFDTALIPFHMGSVDNYRQGVYCSKINVILVIL